MKRENNLHPLFQGIVNSVIPVVTEKSNTDDRRILTIDDLDDEPRVDFFETMNSLCEAQSKIGLDMDSEEFLFDVGDETYPDDDLCTQYK